MVSRAIERAQSNVEQQNFEIRKNVLKYDDVLNTQRHVIYDERTQLLGGEEFAENSRQSRRGRGFSAPSTPTRTRRCSPKSGICPASSSRSRRSTRRRSTRKTSTDRSFDEVREIVLRDMNEAYVAKEAELGTETMRRAERLVFLNVLDAAWRDHLYEMDYLREGIGLRAMGQRDPLVEYQREGFELFQNVVGRIRDDFARYIFHVSTVAEDAPQRRGVSRCVTRRRRTRRKKAVRRSSVLQQPAAPAAPQAEPAMAGAPADGCAGRRRCHLRDHPARRRQGRTQRSRARAGRARSTNAVTASPERSGGGKSGRPHTGTEGALRAVARARGVSLTSRPRPKSSKN